MTAHTSREVRGDHSQRAAPRPAGRGLRLLRLAAVFALTGGWVATADAEPYVLVGQASTASVPLPAESGLDFDSVLVDESAVSIGGADGTTGAFDPDTRSDYDLIESAPVLMDEGVFVSDQAGVPAESMIDRFWSSCTAAMQDAGGLLRHGDAGCPLDACGVGGCGHHGCRHCGAGVFSSCWDVQVEAMMLWQGNVQRQPIVVNDATGAPALVANEILAPMASGPRVAVIRPVGCNGHSLEGVYFCVQPFAGQAAVPRLGQTGPFALPTEPPFNDISAAQVMTGGRFQNAELNWRRYDGGLFTWLAGFRWVELNQSLTSTYAFANPDPFGTGNYSVVTGNNLYGGQAGGLMKLWNSGSRFTVDGIGKAGIFYNQQAYQRSSAQWVETGTGNVVSLGNPTGVADQTAFVGELGINGTLWLTHWLAWRAGYTAFWLSGVATPPQQIPVVDFSSAGNFIDTNGSVLIHGATTGLEARW